MTKASIHSVKLTDSIRSSIRAKLIGDRFLKRQEDLILLHADLAERLYVDIFPKADREFMYSAKKGFFRECESINVAFGNNNVVVTYFSGWHDDLSNCYSNERREWRESHTRRFPFDHAGCSKSLKSYATKHPLAVAYFEIKKQSLQIEKDQKSLQIEVDGALNSATTTGKLISIWPEIEPLIREFAPIERTNLPAPILHALNSKLGLKPIKHAA